MNQSSLTTRLGEYISLVLPAAHGHQRKAVTDFVSALVSAKSCCQATLARCFDNFEAASKRLSRLLHNARLDPDELALAHARAVAAQLPPAGAVRLSLDWTSEGAQHLLIASLRVGRRAVPVYWRAYRDSELKQRMSLYQREFARHLFGEVLRGVERRRFVLTADRWFAGVDLLDLLDELGVSYVIRTKSSYKVRVEGRWGVWHLLSNRPLSAVGASREYARRFTCEEGFRDGKRLLGFAEARIKCVEAWARLFLLVALALLVLTRLGCALLERAHHEGLLRRVRSRRRTRSELSLVRSIVELLTKDDDLWQLLDHHSRLNLEAGL